MNSLVAAYAMVVGVFMIGFWGFLVATGQAELRERPWDMRFHLTAEFATAVLLLLSGAGALVGFLNPSVLGPVALGMLLYTVVNSPGFYAGKGNRPMVAMFGVLAALTLTAIAGLVLGGA